MKRLNGILCNLEELLCVVILSIMVLTASLNIIARYIPGISFASSEELVVNLFVWLTMIGAVVAIKQNAHIAINFMTTKLPEKYHRLFLVIRFVAVVGLFAIILIYSSWETWAEYKSGIMTYSLGWPLWIFTFALPIGSLLFLIHFCLKTIQGFRETKDSR